MKRLFTFFAVAIIFNACLSEKGADAGKPATFIRYYYGGNNDTAVAFEETSDKGFIILSTVTTGSEAVAAKYKIKLTKTDEFGNIVWQKRFPEFNTPQDTISYRASGIQILQNGGYVVTGEHIQKHNSQLFIMTLDNTGAVQKPMSIANPDDPKASLFGKAVSVSTSGNFYVLGFSGTSEMLLTELKKDDLTPAWGLISTSAWFKKYEAGETTLNNHLFTDEAGKIFWSGTVKKSNTTGIRVVKTSPNSQNTEFDLTLVNPGSAKKLLISAGLVSATPSSERQTRRQELLRQETKTFFSKDLDKMVQSSARSPFQWETRTHKMTLAIRLAPHATAASSCLPL